MVKFRKAQHFEEIQVSHFALRRVQVSTITKIVAPRMEFRRELLEQYGIGLGSFKFSKATVRITDSTLGPSNNGR
jgi:hypothetical protein